MIPPEHLKFTISQLRELERIDKLRDNIYSMMREIGYV